MTRILQVRRGSAAQHDSFTGLTGEITMDTTLKTLRVHDGETLGGIPLARRDEITQSDFDINSVSATFWTNLFATYQTPAPTAEHSSLITLTNSTFIDYAFETDKTPIFCDVYLICQSPEAGYSIDDAVRAFGIGDYAYPRANTFMSGGVLNARLFVGEKTFWVFHKTDGTKTNITNENWKLKISVYY